jgi:hypothetical protein
LSAIALVPSDELAEPPPYSEDAEQAVLSAMLADVDAVAKAASMLDASMFYREANRRVYNALLAIRARGSAIDPLILTEELESEGELKATGGRDYISYLLDVVPTAANVQHHAAIVARKAEQRLLVEQFSLAQKQALEGHLSPAEIIAGATAALSSIGRKTNRYQLLDDGEIERLPMAEWIIPDTLPARALVVVIGAPKSLKTFLMLLLSACVSLGMDFHGRPTRPGRVIYIYAEGVSGLRKRLSALKRYLGIDQIGIEFLPHRVSVNRELDIAALLAAIKASGDTMPSLIVIDTLNRCIDGDENSSVDMGGFIRGCDALKEQTGATVAVVHHTGLASDSRSRGHTSLAGAVDAQFLISRDDDRVTLENQWMKDGPDDWRLAFQVLPVAQSLVLEPSGLHAGKLTGQRREVLDVLHRQSTESGMTHGAWLKAAGLESKKSSFGKAREWLVANSYVKQERGKYHINEAGIAALSTKSTTGPHPNE